MTFRAIDHTADVGFDLVAPTLADLYARAGAALSDTITRVEDLGTPVEETVDVRAADRESLMVEWLEELLFRFDVTAFLGRDFRVDVEESGDGFRLRARVAGEIHDPRRHAVKTAVKGATWHGLVVEPDGRQWRGRVILDV